MLEHLASYRAGRWPLRPIAPAMVAVIAIATAVTIAFVGLRQLQRTSDDASAVRAKTLAAALAARMRSTALADRPAVLARAARRSGAEILLVDQNGDIRVDQGLAPLEHDKVMRLLVEAEGETETTLGRVRFATSPLSPPLEHLSVLILIRAPLPAAGTISLSNAIAVLTALLIGVAVAVAVTFMRAARDDVAFVRRRIAKMAEVEAATASGEAPPPARRAVPIRSLDQVGLVTAALNLLITRFAAAERTYRADLSDAAALDAERSQFLAGLSHELRTPLNAILGFTHVLESEADGPLSEDSKESLGVIRTSGEHLRTLIDDILDLSAMETGQLRLSRQQVDVYALAQDVVREACATIESERVSLTVAGTSGAQLYADPRRLRQVLTNLVANAIKFTESGQVQVTIADDDRGVTLAVADTGRGIPPELLPSIFRAYQQGSDAKARRAGAGLGLAIARRLIQLHGGSIEVASTLGRGTTFTVFVPRGGGANADDQEAEPDSAADREPPHGDSDAA